MSQVLRIEHTHLQSPNVFCNVHNAYDSRMNFRDTVGAVDIMEEMAGCGRAAADMRQMWDTRYVSEISSKRYINLRKKIHIFQVGRDGDYYEGKYFR